jgi:hypothetical protein
MYLQRRLVSYVAMLIATIYYLFGKAEAAEPPLAAGPEITIADHGLHE